MAKSMTGFARQEMTRDGINMSCEIRSVNHRYLETSFRMPDHFRQFEPLLKEKLKKQLSRGKIEINIQSKTDIGDEQAIHVNQDALTQLISTLNTIQSSSTFVAQPTSLDLLKWPGVLKASEIDNELIKLNLLELFDKSLTQLQEGRIREGESLSSIVLERVDEIEAEVTTVKKLIPNAISSYLDKLRSKIEALEVELDEDRFTQEATYLSQKADVAEEIDRLFTHIKETRHIFTSDKPIGRRLDFLMQEFNREANTLSSKAISPEITRSAVNLKVLIEQIREQIQNVE